MLPFTQEQFFGVFERYNQAVWPMQVVLFGLGLVAVGLAARPTRWADRVVSAILSFLWIWMGVAYHWLYFSAINPAAYLFGAMFVAQGALFVYAGIARRLLSVRPTRDTYVAVGGVFLFYALVGYPVLGYLVGHRYPASPTSGVPCPTTILTFGLLLWTDRRLPKYLLVVPFLWSLVGSSAAVLLGVVEDLGLLVAGILGTVLILVRDRRRPRREGLETGRESRVR